MPKTQTTTDTAFRGYLAALENYVTREGHTRVPIDCIERIFREGVPETIRLGYWVSYMRSRKRAGFLSEDKIEAVNAASNGQFEWGPLKPGPKKDQSRDQQIRELRSAGVSLTKIGEQFGVTRQRVHQIINS